MARLSLHLGELRMIDLDSIYIATYNIHRFKQSDFKR